MCKCLCNLPITWKVSQHRLLTIFEPIEPKHICPSVSRDQQHARCCYSWRTLRGTRTQIHECKVCTLTTNPTVAVSLSVTESRNALSMSNCITERHVLAVGLRYGVWLPSQISVGKIWSLKLWVDRLLPNSSFRNISPFDATWPQSELSAVCFTTSASLSLFLSKNCKIKKYINYYLLFCMDVKLVLSH
jgi:hypothetical protein